MTNQNNALHKIQQELKAPKNKTNDFGKYKYRNCEDILEAVKPHLNELGATLVLTDEVQQVGSVVVITAKAVFTDAEGKEITVTAHAGVDVNKKGMDVAQTFGASSSYARKYALNGLFLIDDTKDYDTNEYHQQMDQASKNQSNRNNNNQGQQSNQSRQANNSTQSLAQRYNNALASIKNAKYPSTLDKAIATFANSQYAAGISNACRARADQMGWNFNSNTQQQNQTQPLHH
ncbi:ERF family protein [Acinetobacter sp. V91_7]|uniref:ERF family protein n=1 Tax=unclassified Acinetobacter TaxID=196816 RepID=UPI00287EA51C|nr:MULTISPECIES: ERF family protein [unclassified Acinetobacter]MDS7935636.1 ERF family protein [Acinetobacter sp. V91_4B]MDS7964756.1 ERF family protein [Acinetobacter sp. V91_7]MDS8025549.1 ERF family protein [Acinetobacter sp. V91_13]